MGRPGGKLLFYACVFAGHARGVQVSELCCAPVLGVDAQGRAGGAKGAYLAQFAAGAQVQAGFLAVGKKSGACAKKGGPHIGTKAPQRAPVGCEFVAGLSMLRPAGLPSKMQQVVPLSRPPICAFHITQPVELYQW